MNIQIKDKHKMQYINKLQQLVFCINLLYNGGNYI